MIEYIKLLRSSPHYNPSILPKPSSLATLNNLEKDFVRQVFKKGKLMFNSGEVTVNCLFDSGALHCSYVHKKFVDNNREIFEDYIHPCRTQVRMGDSETVQQICEVLLVEIKFEKEVTLLSLFIFNTNIDVIVGFPDIVRYFKKMFIEIIDRATVNEDLAINTLVCDENNSMLEDDNFVNS